ncbi:MAG: hypothetical protein JXA46_18320 [Dehalococcoidales bacterium]|nr:hypothetical protein [Dehalococcoidales bacterium]
MSDPVLRTDVLHPCADEALEIWAVMVRANREQAERFREKPETSDFYAPTASIFRFGPGRNKDAALDILRSLARLGDTWIDIGAGGGSYALPLASLIKEVIAVEPSSAMRSVLYQGISENGIRNITVLEDRWPFKDPPSSDVALMAHVGYDIEEIGPFLSSMEASARRLCVAVLSDRISPSTAERFWPEIHGEKRNPLPSLREFLFLQIARGYLCEVRLVTQPAPLRKDREMLMAFLRQQLFIEPGGTKDRKLIRLVEREMKEKDGRSLLTSGPGIIGIISWQPR